MKHTCAWMVSTLLVTMAASAQTELLSLNTAIELALENDVRLLPGKTALQIAQLQQDSPTVWKDPEARFETSLNSEENYVDPSLRFYVPHPWLVRAGAQERAARTDAASANHQTAEATTVAEVYLLYREFQCLEKEIFLADRLAEIKKELFVLAEQQVAAAMKTSGKALLSRWELREAERKVRTLRRERDGLKNRLASRTGLDPNAIQLPALELPENFLTPDSGAILRAATGQRPDLRRLQAELKEADAHVKLARAESVPWLNHVQTGYSGRSDEWDVQVAVNIPIFSLRSSKKRVAIAERALRQTILSVSEQAAAAQVREALDRLDGSAAEWAAHRAEQNELTEATQEEIEKLKEFAPSSPGDWLALEERLVQAEHGVLQTLRAVYDAQADLILVTGSLSIQE